ncbi:MAG TPA: bifunctional [glutamate--ammonia ligase]-adenylyl-L-tyrosine phosphorylase/[glutamate--ammonia-ligase] adenylyltransferase [Planctomycetota bacterium]|nr:bifunctional [glutamate--ammonia ligase]-adenylyl-L-tyrosine phosphorylase/[glutamate--ammonia-ligase] adenylyltransferase [Planctomycetota bacterium]
MTAPADNAAALLDQLASSEQLTDEQWAKLDFASVPRVKDALAQIRSAGWVTTEQEPGVLRALYRSSDPSQALFTLQRWLESGGRAEPAWQDPEFLALLATLFAATPALSEHFIRFPNRTRTVLDPVLQRQIIGGYMWRQIVHSALAGCEGYNQRLSVLRRTRVECMLQIAALDLIGVSQLHDTTRALSDLADACIEAALAMAIDRIGSRLGVFKPRADASTQTPFAPPPPFVVFALGKLGGRELNYSSDIDLVFGYDAKGESVETSRPTEASAWFTALGEEIVTILDKVTEDGRVYRVDMRLRPHGAAGPLVRSFEEMRNYFQTEGRTWERQAWLKARAAAGDIQLGAGFLKELDSFIYRKYLSLDAISDIQALKRQIELSVARRGETEDEVKLGKGGIRDIEFTVQFLQMLHGIDHQKIRGGNSLRALYDLRKEGLLSDREVEPLADAYVFLRNVEHRLQLHGDQQVHRLPSDSAARRRIARSLGYSDLYASGPQPALTAQEAFEADRVRHTSRTREVFQRLFANLFRESSGAEGEISDLLLAPQPDIPRIAALLPKFGFASKPADLEAAARELVDLGQERLILTSPSRTRKFFASIAPQLLKALGATGEPDDALRRFSRIAGSLGAKAVFYQMLNENPWLLKMTAELAAWSEYLTDILVANPGLFDELVDALQTGQSKSMKEMHGELTAIVHGGDISDTLRAYRAGELLRIGVRDLIHDASLEQTQHELSDLAEAILRVHLDATQRALTQRKGEVKTAQNKAVGFAILGLGKFGGREMNYGSDLDVIYFYASDGQTADGLPATSYFSELAQELTRSAATPTSLGSLYELDARLRPNGNKGPLALSLDDFKRYWSEGQLADWERLALTRARFVAGDERVGERALHMIRSAVYSPLKDTAALAKETADMRRRLEETADSDDLKRGRGGIMDIEFLVQYLQLIHGPAFPPLRQSNTEQSLRGLMKFKKMTADDAQALLESYEFLRRMENRVRIVHGLSAHKLPQKHDALRKLALRAGYEDSSEVKAEQRLKDDYARNIQRTREIFEKIVGKVP